MTTPPTDPWAPGVRAVDVPIDEGLPKTSLFPPCPNKTDIAAHLYALFPAAFVQAYPDAMVEVIYGPPGVFTVSRWFSAFDLETIVEFAEERSASGDNVYVGAALRKGPIPETGRANEVENYLAAQHGWSEYEGDGDHERIASICTAKGLQPAIKIVTGTTPYPREHLYFRIKGGISSIAEQKAVNTALRNFLSSDDVRDAIRILRLGGCINTPTAEKYAKKYIRELVTVQVAREPREYTVEELLALCGAEIVDNVIDLNEVKSRRTDDELFNLLEETKIAKHWHNAMRNAIATMIGRGWSDDAIRFSCAPYCIGGKDDPDLDALIDGGRTKWDKPNPDNSQPQASATTAKVIYYNDLDALPPKVWLIKNVLAAGETSNWFGPPGYAKSALLVDVSFHAASDQDWRGYRTKKKCGVVYFALERGLLVTRRLAYLHKSTGKADLPIAVVPGIMNLMHPGCVKYVVGTIRTAEARFQCEVGLVIIDTISKGIAAGGGDEDKAKDVNIVLANLRRIEEQLDVHIAVVGHTGKDQKKGHRGSSAHIGDVDLMVQISKSGEVMTATVIKANDQPDGDLTHFKIEVVETDIDEDGDPVVTTIVSDELVEAGKEAKSNRLSGAQSRALELLTRCINDVGRPPPASTQYPKNIRVVSLFEWHTMCELGYRMRSEPCSCRVDEWERFDLVIKPFMNFVVASCDERLPDLEADLASKGAQDASHPWEDWILELIGLFDQYGLPTSAAKDADKAKPGRKPSKFVIFIRELQQLIEPQYRQHTHSDEALAAAITRARSLREGDQTRQDEPRESEQAPIGARTEDPPSE